MISVKAFQQSISRRQDEKTKFTRMLQTMVWAKERTGKSSAEIISLILRKGKFEITQVYY